MEHFEDTRAWLESEYLSRRKKNAAYSLRAFARHLDIPSGRVSQLLARKRKLTPKLGLKIANRLGYDPRKTERLLEVLRKERGGSTPAPQRTYRQLGMDQFQGIADPLHFTILSLAEIDGFKFTEKSVAKRLGISVVEARAALSRLVRLELIQKEKSGFALVPGNAFTTTHDIQSVAIRKAHKRMLLDAVEMLETLSVEERDITSITMAVDPDRLAKAKVMIRDFRRNLSEFLEGGNKTEVFRLQVQLLPITKRNRDEG